VSGAGLCAVDAAGHQVSAHRAPQTLRCAAPLPPLAALFQSDLSTQACALGSGENLAYIGQATCHVYDELATRRSACAGRVVPSRKMMKKMKKTRLVTSNCRHAALEHHAITGYIGCYICAGFCRALITLGSASAAIALVYAFAAALGRPSNEQQSLAPAAAPADPPAELATILPCTPQQPVRISGGCVSES